MMMMVKMKAKQNNVLRLTFVRWLPNFSMSRNRQMNDYCMSFFAKIQSFSMAW